MSKLIRIPHDRLHLLAENYRRARRRARMVRSEHERIELDGRYHLDGVSSHAVRDHHSHHEERTAAFVLADSVVRWLDGHE